MTSTTGRSADLPRPACGFTLFELVLVMLLLTVVMALAAPSLRGFIIGRKGTDAAAQFIAVGRYAREQAISSGVTYALSVDVTQGTYWLTAQRGSSFHELGNEFGRQFHFPEGTVAQWEPGASVDDGRMYFFPDGRTEAAVLQLTGAGGQVFEIGCRSETEPLTILNRGTQ
jgi:Tfp pilus assembly protein FimT